MSEQSTEFELAKAARFTILESNRGKHKSIWAGDEDITSNIRMLIEAAAAVHDKRVKELEGEVAELKGRWIYYQDLLSINGFDGITDCIAKFKQLQANNHDLREALEIYAAKSEGAGAAKQALSATPAESLQAHDDDILDKLAELAIKLQDPRAAVAILALKQEVK